MRAMMLVITLAGSARAETPALKLSPPGSFAAHNQRVQRAFLRFSTRQSPERDCNRLELLREADRLRLFQERAPGDQTGYGVAVFGALTVFSAHAPARLRALFDGPVHIGPAIFEPAGMGAGIGGRFL